MLGAKEEFGSGGVSRRLTEFYCRPNVVYHNRSLVGLLLKVEIVIKLKIELNRTTMSVLSLKYVT